MKDTTLIYQGKNGEEVEFVNDIKLTPNPIFVWRNRESDPSKEAKKVIYNVPLLVQQAILNYMTSFFLNDERHVFIRSKMKKG